MKVKGQELNLHWVGRKPAAKGTLIKEQLRLQASRIILRLGTGHLHTHR